MEEDRMTTVDLSEIEGALDYVLDELSWAAKERDVARVKFLAEELAGLEEDWPTEFRKASEIIKWRISWPHMSGLTPN
jgi:hypothetical protein